MSQHSVDVTDLYVHNVSAVVTHLSRRQLQQYRPARPEPPRSLAATAARRDRPQRRSPGFHCGACTLAWRAGGIRGAASGCRAESRVPMMNICRHARRQNADGNRSTRRISGTANNETEYLLPSMLACVPPSGGIAVKERVRPALVSVHLTGASAVPQPHGKMSDIFLRSGRVRSGTIIINRT